MFVAELVRRGFPSIRRTGDRDARPAFCAVLHNGELCSVWANSLRNRCYIIVIFNPSGCLVHILMININK